MTRVGYLLAAVFLTIAALQPALAQKHGGILRMYSPDSPSGMSVLEESSGYAQIPMMGVFNNLIMFDQHVNQNSLASVVPDLAMAWSWNPDNTALTFKLRPGVKWHDGKPFTAKDVLCTWDLLMETSQDKLRINPRKSSYRNLERVTANGDYEVTFHLKRPQPAFPMILAGGFSVVYPCHVPAAQMRRHPVGTGPFVFVEYKPNERIKVVRNPDYWKPNRPYLDGIEYTIIRNPATAVLSFVSNAVDMTFPYELSVPLLKDVKSQVPEAICEMVPSGGVNRHLIVNRTIPPFDNPDLRRAMALSLDRKAFVDILTEGEGDIGGVLQPAPAGLWGMPPDQLKELPGYGTDIAKNRAEARQIMEKLGYGPANRLKLKITTRDQRAYRDPAILLMDQLKEIYIDAELDAVDLAVYFPRIQRKEFTVGLNLQTSGPDPDPVLELFYGCGSNLNWDAYCSPETDKLIAQQSMEADPDKRRQLLWTIERKLAAENVRPILFYSRGATCWRPAVKGLTLMVNSLFSGNRYEDIWLDR